jgi:hypothetical protein
MSVLVRPKRLAVRNPVASRTAYIEQNSSGELVITYNGAQVANLSEGPSWLSGSLTAVTDTTAGGILSLANPLGVTLIITRFIIRISTGSTGAATGDFGVAADGTTSSDVLLDGVNMQTTGALDNIENQGTNGVSSRLWTSSQFVTGTASATLAGLVGTYYIQYIIA